MPNASVLSNSAFVMARLSGDRQRAWPVHRVGDVVCHPVASCRFGEYQSSEFGVTCKKI